MVSLLTSSFFPLTNNLSPFLSTTTRKSRPGKYQVLVVSASSENGNDNRNSSEKSTRLVTFLGKGGSGKTTAAAFAAQHYAMAGLSTCLVIHTQDPTVESLLGCKIGTSPILCNNNLSAVRLETTKMLLEPLNRLKQADARVNMTQGALEGIVGEELGVLPGMDSIFSALALERFLGFFGNVAQTNHQKDKFDVIIYDGISSEEMLRLIGASSKARLYLKYLRNLAEKTEIGRLAGPSFLRLVDEAMIVNNNRSPSNGRMSGEVWDTLDRLLEKGASAFLQPSSFGCFLTMDASSPTSVSSALRIWGCTIQAGAQVSGVIAHDSSNSGIKLTETSKENFLPLPFASIPHLSTRTPLDWNSVMLNNSSRNARNLLHASSTTAPTVKFDAAKKSVTLLIPGFDKSEIKLYQYRGGSELLVEAGDQRRVIHLPAQLQGKVGGAKFIERSLVVTLR